MIGTLFMRTSCKDYLRIHLLIWLVVTLLKLSSWLNLFVFLTTLYWLNAVDCVWLVCSLLMLYLSEHYCFSVWV